MKSKVVVLALALAAWILAWILTGCDPQRGDTCPHVGDTWERHGKVLHCTQVSPENRIWT